MLQLTLIRNLLSLGFTVVIAYLLFDYLELFNTGMLFMLPILFSALHDTQKTTFYVSLLSVITFNILFIAPRFSLHVTDMNYLLSFAIMIATGQMVSSLAKQAQSLKELEMSKKIQDTLLESLSHELRTPLAVIKGCSSGLLEKELHLNKKEQVNLIETIDLHAEEMEQLIGNLINSAKLKNGSLTLKKCECDLEEIIGSALLKTEHDQTASLHLPSSIPLIQANPSLIEQALINLLDNAFKYGHNVTLKLLTSSNGVKITLCNQGLIPLPEEIDNATSPFVRLSNSSSKRGLGLGLHVVKLIAEIHHGTLTLNNEKDHFCATLYLPKGVQ